MDGSQVNPSATTRGAWGIGPSVRTVVLVEGESDRVAVEVLARRLRRDLGADGVAVVAMGGAHAIGKYVAALGTDGLGLRLAGLCDAGEQSHFARALERAGYGSNLSRDDLAMRGFFVCDLDLEDELIRALGVSRVEAIFSANGEASRYRTFNKQPAQQQVPIEARLRRFIATRSGAKARYARAMVEALDLDAMPEPLARLLDHV